jgi:glycosyltransferase involved in cell wall biosynthesis
MKKINVMAPINPLGYGVVGLNVVKALAEEWEVSLFPIGQPDVSTQEDLDAVQKCIDNAKTFDAKAPCLRIWHQFSMAEQIGNGLRCGFPIFELDTFNKAELHHLNSLDKIFVCSEWAKEVVVSQLYNNYKRLDLSNNVHVAYLGVDLDIFKPEQKNTRSTTTFFNIGKWEFRKGHDVLAEAFNLAFDEDDDVELRMMNHNPFLSAEQEREWVSLYKDSKMGSKISILPRVQTHKEVADVMNSCDCGVFPSRGEGWNLEALETLACGKELIITDYSAHTAFCTHENSYLIGVEDVEPAFDGIWFHGQGNWASLEEKQIKDLASQMKAVHEKKQKNPLLHNENGAHTASSFTWKNTAHQISLEIS